eukprot:SAG22_NODE_937_length_6418_cov_124.858680_3_plen_95_part_00
MDQFIHYIFAPIYPITRDSFINNADAVTTRRNRLRSVTNISAVDAAGAETAAQADLANVIDVGTDPCVNIRYDVFAVTDMIIYITADGSVSTRI